MLTSSPINSEALAPHYSDFKVTERILLTGHSHQAWPNVAREGLFEAWDDAALGVDHKWERAFNKAELVREGFRKLLGGINGDFALAQNTHDLLVRFLSALDWKTRKEILVTDGEFHTVRRQLLRLEEEGIRIRRVSSLPAVTLGSRLAEQLNHETALVITSTVFFDSGQRAGELAVLAKACGERGVPLLLDAYHHLNIVPFDPSGLDHAYIIGGGYKYCQFGEGNCFLRAPMDCELRPVITGWFADFESLDGAPKATVQYGTSPGARFAGATYDPTSHYRAARVLSFFEDQSLSVERLRSRSQEQLSLLSTGFDALNLPDSLIRRDRNIQIQELAGFLTLKTPRATEFERELLIQGIWTDHRNEALRLGPAPYITDEQLRQAINVLGKVAKSMI